jgi:hypothetical protein
LPITSTDNWNKSVILTALINARNQYIAKFEPNIQIQLPSSKLLPIAIASQSQMLVEICLSSLSRDKVMRLLYNSLTNSYWKIASVLIKIHNKIVQSIFDEGKYPVDLQICYIRFFRIMTPISADQQTVGTQLLLLLRAQKNKPHFFQQISTILLDYLAFEITYGDIENFISALNQYNHVPDLPAIKIQLLIKMLNMTLVPISCEKKPELIKPWLTALLDKPIDLNIADQTMHQLKFDILRLGNADIFDLLNKHFSLFIITCDLIKYCVDNECYILATHLLTHININNINVQTIVNILSSPQLSLSFIENAYAILRSKSIQISAIDLQQLLTNAIGQGNIRHVYDIIKKHPVLINEDAIQLAIKSCNAKILRLLLEHITISMNSNKLLNDIVTMEINPFSSVFNNNVKSTKADLLQTVIIFGHENSLDQIENVANQFLHQLIAQEDRDAIALLLRLGCNPLVIDFKKRSALTFAKEKYKHVDVAIEEDSFDVDFADLENQNSTTTHFIDDSSISSNAQNVNDEIIALLTEAENNHKAIITTYNTITHLYRLVQSNQFTATIQFLNENSKIKSMLADKDNPLGIDLLNIILFKTHNSLMLKYLLSASMSVQICEPAMNRIFFQIMHLILETKTLNKPIYLELFEILCIQIFSNLNAKKLFNDIELLRMFIQITVQDILIISRSMNLIDKFVAAFGAELFYHPLITENITDIQAISLAKLCEVYPQNKPLADCTVATPTPSSTVCTATAIPVRTASRPSSTILRSISNTPRLLTFAFTSNESPERSNKRTKPDSEMTTIKTSLSP